METLISIVIPIYNVEKYLDRCIESIVNQTYKNLEIILVDDGSTDGSPAICDLWAQKDSRIKTIHKQNEGAGFTRNVGIENATGKYIFFIDSDDYVDLTMVEKCLVNAQKYDSDVVMFGRNDDVNGTVKKRRIIEGDPVFLNEDVQEKVLPTLFTYELGIGTSASMKMFKLDVISENNIRFKSERNVISEDTFFVLEYFYKVNIATVVSENFYYYYKRGASLTTSYKKNRQQLNDRFLEICLQSVSSVGLYDKLAHHIMAKYHGLTLGALMHIVRSDISYKEKFKAIKEILHSKTLLQTLSLKVIKWDGRVPRIFWLCLKFRCYFLCYLLLMINSL